MLSSFTQLNTFCDVESTPRDDAISLQSHVVKTVGERIRQAREARGLSGEQLANAVGYKTQSAIANLENRATGQGGNKIGDIARALQVPLEWLLTGTGSEAVPFQHYYDPPLTHASTGFVVNDTDIHINEAVSLMQRMSTAGRLEALNFLRYLSSQHSAPATPEHGAESEDHSVPNKKAA